MEGKWMGNGGEMEGKWMRNGWQSEGLSGSRCIFQVEYQLEKYTLTSSIYLSPGHSGIKQDVSQI